MERSSNLEVFRFHRALYSTILSELIEFYPAIYFLLEEDRGTLFFAGRLSSEPVPRCILSRRPDSIHQVTPLMTTHQRGQRNTENNHEIHHGDTRTPPAASPLAGVLLAVLFNYLSAKRGRRQVVTWVGTMTHSDKRNETKRFRPV